MDPDANGKPIQPPAGAVRLLCLDGGGVKGISSLMILDAIMERIAEIEQEKGSSNSSQRFPVQYFDLAGGTSTGGLAALMMFRLKLSTTVTMENYDKMAKQIFSPGLGLDRLGRLGYNLGNFVLGLKTFFLPARFSAKPLEKAVDKVVKDSGIPAGGEAALLDDTRGKMLMCSTLAEKGETILFRSYTPPSDSTPVTGGVKDMDFSDVKIHEAARATSAAPTYLPEMIIKGFKFWDGGLLNNNPIDQVWDARYDLAINTTETPIVSCVVSLGTSWSTNKPASSNFFKRFLNTLSQTISFATNTEAKHRDFERNIGRVNRRLPAKEQTAYFRFNAPTGTETINLDDWHAMGKLKKYTKTYLKDPKIVKQINDCAQVLAK